MSTCENVDNEGLLWKFEINNGNVGVMKITDALLYTEERAEERAMSEFLRNSFAKNPVNFSTYVTYHFLNKTIKVGGLNYTIDTITTTGDEKKIVATIGGKRYD